MAGISNLQYAIFNGTWEGAQPRHSSRAQLLESAPSSLQYVRLWWKEATLGLRPEPAQATG